MSGDVRSFEEAVLAALTERPDIASPGTRTRAAKMAKALREWCLDPQQIEAAASVLSSMTNGQTVWPMDRERTRAVLEAVMGNTP